MIEKKPLIKLENLNVNFPVKGSMPFTKKKYIQAVTDISLEIFKGETFGVVGESGCGKSTLANAIIGMLKPTSGKVYFKDQDLFSLPRNEFKDVRRSMQMIFQDPFSSLNPRFNVFQIISEPMLIRGDFSKKEMEEKVIELLNLVGLSDKDLYRYPSDFSGGQKQRIGIARAISLNPDFLICDEPVSALDVSVHAQILNLLVDLQEKLGITYLFISHNLAVVKNICDRIMVMYLGKVMEFGDTKSIYKNPKHPYTRALLSAILDLDIKREKTILKGDIPSPTNPPIGCRFWQRCPYAMEGCINKVVPLIEVEKDHFVACHLISGFSDEEVSEGLNNPVDKT
ncbi:MAG: oligopeptide/dipeptide ABC transporter ATP-binding protein [Candidatus Izemoplasmatales bacterium]